MGDDRFALANLITTGDDQADIYSMVRLRRGYAGYCRRVRRASDGAMLDVGFAADGAYDIDRELSFAGDSDVYLQRWYNQSVAAGSARPGWLEARLSDGAPRTAIAGCAIRVEGRPAIEMQRESWLVSVPATRVAADGAVRVVWIGCAAAFDGFDSGLWSIHEEGIDDARTCEVDGTDRGLLRDRGCYYGRASLCTHPSGEFTAASVIVAVHRLAPPWPSTFRVNGSAREASYQGAVAGVGLGAPQLLGPNRVHTFIVDGAADCAICGVAIDRFGGEGWIG